jgi:precorrin-8X/cobalt-precorrin-8 methylmutase
MEQAMAVHPGAVVLVGSAPTALDRLLELVAAGAAPPALVIGMPVGFVGVAESKQRLELSALPQIRLDGSRGGAGLVAAAVNALLRRAWLDQAA